MEQIRNSQRCCATCGYWLGNRTADRRGCVIVASPMEKGQCSAHALTEHFTRQANYSCGRYQKWAALH